MCKTIFAAAPFHFADKFKPAHVRAVDPGPYAPDLKLEYS
jgi:gallate decarboxylase subunit C